jgi:16S rRNA (uracil1498-N3)-methyltransferase
MRFGQARESIGYHRLTYTFILNLGIAMTRRYFVADLPQSGGIVTLCHAEAHHAIHVMRVQVGDAIELFDGKGNQSQADVTKLGRNECQCEAEPSNRVDREPPRVIHFGIALPKPDRARELIERLTELGVKTLTPLVAERPQRPPSDALIDKLRRGVIEACKQSGRNQLLEVRMPQNAADFFASRTQAAKMIAHPAGDAVWLDKARRSGEAFVAIGPEGGWTDSELSSAVSCHFEPINLGRRIYRIETAATVVAACLSV